MFNLVFVTHDDLCYRWADFSQRISGFFFFFWGGGGHTPTHFWIFHCLPLEKRRFCGCMPHQMECIPKIITNYLLILRMLSLFHQNLRGNTDDDLVYLSSPCFSKSFSFVQFLSYPILENIKRVYWTTSKNFSAYFHRWNFSYVVQYCIETRHKGARTWRLRDVNLQYASTFSCFGK